MMCDNAWSGSVLARILPTLLTATPRSIQPRMLWTRSISDIEYRRCPLSVRVGTNQAISSLPGSKRDRVDTCQSRHLANGKEFFLFESDGLRGA